MDKVLVWVAAVVALLVVAPLVALFARRAGRRVKGGLILAGILLGVGEVVDPPSKHLIEATGDEERASPAPGEPPLDDPDNG